MTPFGLEQQLWVTLDTEPDCDPHWRRSDPLVFTSVTEGIPKLLRPIWQRTGVKPLYFVSPEVLENAEACAVLRAEVAAGAHIGAHLHSEYVPPNVTITEPAGKPSDEFPCYAHDAQTERAKIANLTQQVTERLGVRPEWYRAGRFGADYDTMLALRDLGYRYDSSVTPDIDWSAAGGPDHSRGPRQPYWIAKDDLYAAAPSEGESLGLIEVPVSIWGRRLGPLGRFLPSSWMAYNWLRPSHMSVFEQQLLVDRFCRSYAQPVLVAMLHSMEVMPNRSPYVRNAWMQRRLLSNMERVIDYARQRLAHSSPQS